MGATITDGPVYIYGNMAGLVPGFGDAVPDYNQDAGPSMSFQGDFLPDVRYPFLKDAVQGYTGRVPGHFNFPYAINVDAIPGALGVATIAAAQNAVNLTPMTLVSVQAAGIAPGIPIRPMTSPVALNAGALTTVLALDFGFAFGNCTAGNASIPVADSTQFIAGEPLVIAGAGPGGAALLTNVLTIPDGTHITVGPNIPTTSINPAAIGTGNYWGPSPLGFPVPDAAMPYVAAGPGLLLDPRQTLCRGVSVTGSTSSVGGNIIITGYDLYGQLQHETLAAPAGATTVFGKKCFKYILSAVPQFADAHTYSIGTSDLFGGAVRGDRYEYQNIFWAGLFNANTQANSGWTAGDQTGVKDVRQTFQSLTADGPGTGPTTGGAASTGTISALAMSGNRLAWFSTIPLYNILNSFPATPQYFYGAVPS